jgi:nucleoside-diphosphate-sugar epimerase
MNVRPDRYVLVTGAGGFIGKPVVERLLQRGWPVKAMVRAPGASPFAPHAQLRVVSADVRDAAALTAAMKDVAVVVHLAAAMADEKWSEEVNVGGAEKLVSACKAAGCTRVINISSQAAKIPRKGTYARTKSEADRMFTNSGLDVTTLMPSVVYGEERKGVFGAVAKFVQKLPIVPVLGDGQWICAPVYIEDVAEAICRCIERDATIGKSYDLGGPNEITFDQLIDGISAKLGLKRRKFHIPFGVALLAARILASLLPRPPITVSNILGSNQNTPMDIGPAQRDLGFDPIDFETGMKKIFG